MIYIPIDGNSSASSGFGGSACATCCCAPISLRPGETELVTLGYAAWTIPLGGTGLVPTPEITITEDTSACSSAPIDGFVNPNTGNVTFNSPQNVLVNTATAFDLTADTFPAGNSFEYRLVPVSGPLHGTLTTPIGGNPWTYTGQPGFNGYDQFWVEITDAQGRKIVRPINLRVGTPAGNPPFGWGINAAFNPLQINRGQLQIDRRLHTISFPMTLNYVGSCNTIDACRRWRVTIKAFATDCDRTFSNIQCFDVRCKACN